jgi:ubiquinone/menaquinone biosynthesis C-methylase UbiE
LVESVKDVFNQIAPGWYNYRHHSIFTKELNSLAERWQNGNLLNLGCAHGPDFLPFKNSFKLYGVDFSEEMLNLAQKYSLKFGFNVELSLADIRQLPYPDNLFDWAIAVATYHHIHGEQEMVKALNELKRVLKFGGEAFITVWNRWQPSFWFKPKEVYVPWHKKNKTLYRYYHLFSYKELEYLAEKVGFKVLKSHPESIYHFPLKYFSKNICLLLKKVC